MTFQNQGELEKVLKSRTLVEGGSEEIPCYQDSCQKYQDWRDNEGNHAGLLIAGTRDAKCVDARTHIDIVDGRIPNPVLIR